MQKESKIQLSQMMSLMERMNKHYTNDQANVLTECLVCEATRIGLNNLESFFTKSRIKDGDWASLGYIQLYPITGQYPSDEFYQKMSSLRGEYDPENTRGLQHFDDYMDRSKNTEWDNPQGRGTKLGKPFAKKIYAYVLKLTTYTINWQNKEGYGHAQSRREQELQGYKDTVPASVRDKYFPTKPEGDVDDRAPRPGYKYSGFLGDYGISTFTDPEGNEISGQYRTDREDPNSLKDYPRRAIRNVLSAGLVTKQKPVYFGVYEDGTIDPIPKTLGRILQGKTKKEIDKLATITDEEERQWAEKYLQYKDADAMANKTFLLKNVAYLCATASDFNGVKQGSVYWRNPEPLFLLKKAATKGEPEYDYQVHVNNEELGSILERFARQEAEEIEGYENPNIR